MENINYYFLSWASPKLIVSFFLQGPKNEGIKDIIKEVVESGTEGIDKNRIDVQHEETAAGYNMLMTTFALDLQWIDDWKWYFESNKNFDKDLRDELMSQFGGAYFINTKTVSIEGIFVITKNIECSATGILLNTC